MIQGNPSLLKNRSVKCVSIYILKIKCNILLFIDLIPTGTNARTS
ncbi:hypothetical protein VMF7928_02651 [Vibrio marisflavi CECT 7928]|uniref:Uncharacterized protein n=1 Tax=Vibrio marisflavi CECT 7928 TaxID=634439 RepID=A0ABM9A5L1_9VIBR|nr:hypothetical protein VMF7928_02651 [Vibrio marisflavi CECT 7928]